jgi:pimeloyl-ACP methyl ester carboxylesterase
VQLASYDFGGDGPPILFIHATGLHAHVWLPVIARLRDRFRCYGIDQRAHGDSGLPPDGDFSWAGLGPDTLEALDRLQLTDAFGVGHSSGGAALFLAEERAPGTFKAIWAFEPIVPPVDHPVPATSADNSMSAAARRRREVFPDRQAAFDNYASKPPFSIVDPDALRAYVDFGFDDLDDGTIRLKCRGDNEARFYEGAGGHAAFGDLALVRCPVTLVRGALGAGFPAAFVEPIAERLPDARIEPMDHLGHFGPMQDPDAIAESIVKAFAAAP